MIKKFFITPIVYIFLVTNRFSAGSSSSGGDGGSIKSNYEKAVSYIKSAKKHEKKGKIKKANKKYEKALKLLIKSDKKKPNQADRNQLG